MSMFLDSRVIRILRWLLDQDRPRSTGDLAADLGLSQRVVRYRLGAAEAYLRSMGAELTRRRGSGLWLQADADTRDLILSDLAETSAAPRVYAPEERIHVVLAHLLTAAPESTSVDDLERILEVSKASARRDLQRAEPWLTTRGLSVVRRPGVGITVVGTESAIRQALVQLMFEAVPEEVLRELCTAGFGESALARVRLPAGIRDHIRMLPLQTCWQLVSESPISWTVAQGNSELVFTLYLAVTASRLAAGDEISLDTGQHRSLVDHPVASTAAGIALEFSTLVGIALPDQEVAGITEYLLGLATLSSAPPESEGEREQLLDDLLETAAEQLHPTLEADPELRRGLALHLERLAVRLRYGLPVHNPLLKEVVDRYPDVHQVSARLGEMIAAAMKSPIAEDEIGYITMYLSGALERSRLAPRRRALVVCPSGMATAWVLVSRIQSEFPQLELVSVIAARDYEGSLSGDIDLVISTVDLKAQSVPVVVVSPLLTPDDVRHISGLV